MNFFPDECKPPLPYEIGTHLIATAFDPPQGLLKHPDDWYRGAHDELEDDIQNLPPLQACLKHPPAEGRLGNLSVQLEILEYIRVSDLKNSQVMKVKTSVVANPSTSDSSHRHFDEISSFLKTPTSWPCPDMIVAAKIYDPLYVDYDDCCPDPFHNCDAALVLETEAYRDYLRPLYGTYVPHFYGSYTIDVPIPENNRFWQSSFGTDRLGKPDFRTRPVRAILYEYIPGISLSSAMEEQMFNQSQRKKIMRALVTAESKTRQLDVLIERDFMPRNVVVTSAEEGQAAEIRLIDFGAVECGTRHKHEGHVPTTELEPICQIIERWRDYDDKWKDPSNLRHPFLDLVDWEWNEWLRHEYVVPTQQIQG